MWWGGESSSREQRGSGAFTILLCLGGVTRSKSDILFLSLYFTVTNH